MGEKPIEALQAERDNLLEALHSVYSGAPSTTYQAYKKAQEALKQLEDMTFSDEEIDAFLPRELKKKASKGVNRNAKQRDGPTRNVAPSPPTSRPIPKPVTLFLVPAACVRCAGVTLAVASEAG